MENIIVNIQRSKSMPDIPIEIINKILMYVGELNNDLIILQYNPYIKNQEFYKINMFSELLWNIQSTLVMQRFYPMIFDVNSISLNLENSFYSFGKTHYEELLRKGIIL